MSALKKIINIGIKVLLAAVLLAISLVPLFYLMGHECLDRPTWSEELDFHSPRNPQIEQLQTHAFSNVFLRNEPTKLTWNEVRYTNSLADYISHQLNNKGVAVVRKNLQFNEPKGEPQVGLVIEQVKTLKESPSGTALKNQIEQYINFEHKALDQKHYLIVSYGALESKIIKEIEDIRKKNPNYRFLVVSPWPVQAEGIISISNEGLSLAELPAPQGENIVKKADKKAGKKEKEPKKEEKKQEKQQEKKEEKKEVKAKGRKKGKGKKGKEEL